MVLQKKSQGVRKKMINKDEMKIAIPSKGRLMEKAVNLLKDSGMKFNISGRRLFTSCSETGITIILSNAQDIPSLVTEGFVDLGITGSDLVAEKEANITEHIKLGFGKCRLSFATHRDFNFSIPPDLTGKTIGTKFVNFAKRFVKENNIKNVKIIEINGAVEVMILLNLVDVILDIVETGSSLREHNLIERITLFESQAVLIGNNSSRNPVLTNKLIRRIKGVLIAKKYSMLEYNCPIDMLDEAKKITPGYSAPTIQKTDSAKWFSVKVMVEKPKVQPVIDQLEEIGCHAIIETNMIHCRL